jgi:hypothetical protein
VPPPNLPITLTDEQLAILGGAGLGAGGPADSTWLSAAPLPIKIKQLDRFSNAARYVSIGETPSRLRLHPRRRASRDARIHGVDVTGGRAAEESIDEDVYQVEAAGPLTPRQREALDARVLDVSRFEPPRTYIVHLRPDQLAAVRTLPFVTQVRRYGLAATVTPSCWTCWESPRAGRLRGGRCAAIRPGELPHRPIRSTWSSTAPTTCPRSRS